MSALWTSDEIAAATGGTASTSFKVTGVTFDSREVQPGDLFVAMPGTAHDGHDFLDTSIAPAHTENRGSPEAMAAAKAQMFEGREPGGTVIIPNDTPTRDRLLKAARRPAERIITFGSGDADIHAVHAVAAESGGSLISATLLERELTFTISQRGDHWVSNALAVLAAVEAAE